MKKISIVFFMSLLLMLTVGCGPAQSEFIRASDFELQDINGNNVRLSSYSGKVILLNFFATWCPPCRNEMPSFNEIYNEFKRNVVVVAVHIGQDDVSRVKNFAETLKLEFPILMDDGTAASLYGPIRAIPVTVVIDRYFNVVKRYVGGLTKQQMVDNIEELLGEWSAR